MTQCANRVLLVGAFPPPPGGNSVHVERLAVLLSSAFEVEVLDPYVRTSLKGDPPNVYRCRPRHPLDFSRALRHLSDPGVAIVHVHVSAMNAFALTGHALVKAINRRARKILTIHSGSFERSYVRANRLRRGLMRSLIGSFDRVVVVNEEQRRLLAGIGIPSRAIALIPAFLPPVAGEPPRELVDLRARCRKLVVTSGYGVAHYGFTTLLDALDRSSAALGAAFFLYNTFDEDYVEGILRRAASSSRVVLRNCSAAEFAGALKLADVYVRATDRDGDAVAIREAAALGARIVASDAVRRPPGCELFTTGDAESLTAALERIWTDERAGRVTIDTGATSDAILGLYRELAAAPAGRAIA
jgi:glycogen synthase